MSKHANNASYHHPPLKSPPLKGGEIFTTTISGIKIEIPASLVKKYNTAVPRYTSYPTAPVWTNKFTSNDYSSQLTHLGTHALRHLSLYFHIPFCEARCLFCGCSTIATPHHEVADGYIEALGKELELVTNLTGKNGHVVQLHFGGGNPTYLTPPQLERLWEKIAGRFSFDSDAEIGIEANPRVTTKEHLKTLRSLGFNRLSLGVQDLSEDVATAIGRQTSFHDISYLVNTARDLGFKSVNFDLIYGLPNQTVSTFKRTIEDVIRLSPNRVACFNFAYLPKMLPHQRKLPTDKLPQPEEKFAIFCAAIEEFGVAGYDFIGMDHFAKKSDELSVAALNGMLWRNFQGYTTKAGTELIGFGLTSISDVSSCYAQNSKKLIDYYRHIESGELAIVKGWRLSKDDLARRKIIRELFCKGEADLSIIPPYPPLKKGGCCVPPFVKGGEGGFNSEALCDLETGGLIHLIGNIIRVTPLGRLFIRNIAAVFDEYLGKASAGFSKAV